MHKLIVALATLAMVTAPAKAEWRQVRTEHFILSIDDTEDNARGYAIRLEKFDAALRLLYGVKENPDQALRPITIYALREDLFNRACVYCPGVLGYYNPDAERSFIVSLHSPDADRKTKGRQSSSQVVLLHEYSHHFMYSNFPVAYPMWFSEGFAEFNANTTFGDDGSLTIGHPASYRTEGLGRDIRVPLKQLFDPGRNGYPDDVSLLYSRGWLLTHLLLLRPSHKGQLDKYLTGINRGEPSMAAAAKAFGDLKALDTELDLYRRGKLEAPLLISPPKPVTATVTTMPPGQAALMPTYIAIRRTAKDYRLGLAIQAEGIAKKYPDDALLQAQVAEMEFKAGRTDRADQAADRALAIQADLEPALVMKGRVAVSRAALANTTDPKVWSAARGWYLKANKSNPNAVMPLYLFYASFVAAKVKPTPSAVKALLRAAVLAPESNGIRLAVARQALADGDGPTAARALQALAYAPHLARDKNVPLDALNLIVAGKLDEARTLLSPKDKDDDWSPFGSSPFGNPDHTSS